MRMLRKVKIEGFKSIATTDLELGDLNVVIGANGSGKSNLIGAFRLLERVLSQNLQRFVGSEPDRFLHHGRKVTPSLALDFEFDQNSYGFKLAAAQDTLIFEYERVAYSGKFDFVEPLAAGHKESRLKDAAQTHTNQIPYHVLSKVNDLVVYHFHDTSDSAPAKQMVDVDDNRFFRPDAANLAAYLYWLQQKHSTAFRHIEEHIRLVAPFFEKFVLAPSKLNESKIKLEWRQKGSDAYFDAYALSDGTLRFICLATLLLQPQPPRLILLDEPELGLHPFAIRILAEMLEVASKRVQVVLATQSVTLLNQFEAKDIVIAENDGCATSFNRLNPDNLIGWVDDYSLGELWEKNVLGGRP
jgi:predicted ATPase